MEVSDISRTIPAKSTADNPKTGVFYRTNTGSFMSVTSLKYLKPPFSQYTSEVIHKSRPKSRSKKVKNEMILLFSFRLKYALLKNSSFFFLKIKA